MSKIKTILSIIFIFTIWGCVSSAYPILLWWSRECVLYLIIIIKPEVWIINHCLGLGHETMVCAVCLTMFLWRKTKGNWEPQERTRTKVDNMANRPLLTLISWDTSIQWILASRSQNEQWWFHRKRGLQVLAMAVKCNTLYSNEYSWQSLRLICCGLMVLHFMYEYTKQLFTCFDAIFTIIQTVFLFVCCFISMHNCIKPVIT